MDDLTHLLEEWPYDPDQTVRIVVASDGRSVLQVRLPLGIEQYEMEGRPDRQRPDGFTTVLEAIEQQLTTHIVEHGSDAGFAISTERAQQLQQEGVLFYSRYLLLFQMQYFDLVIRDTEHNIHLCDVLERYCGDEEARNAVLQFRPYILRMNAAARAMAIRDGHLPGSASEVLDAAIAQITALEPIDSPAFQFERVRSINYLRALARSLGTAHAEEEDEPDSLRTELEQAVANEDYERAARLRDQMRARVDKER